MNKYSLIKIDLLRRKINEYFSAKPKSKSVHIKINEGTKSVDWHVVRVSEKKYQITETKSIFCNFLMEAPPPQPTDFNSAPSAPNIEDPVERLPSGDMDPWDPDNPKGQFASLVAQVGLRKAMLSMPEDKLRQHFGIARTALKGGSTMPVPNPLGNAAVPPDDVKLSHNTHTTMEADNPAIGINVDDEDINDPSIVDPVKPKKVLGAVTTAEEVAIRTTLSGQTIQNVDISSGTDKFEISFALLDQKHPATLKIQKGGAVLYTYKGVNYFLQKQWS